MSIVPAKAIYSVSTREEVRLCLLTFFLVKSVSTGLLGCPSEQLKRSSGLTLVKNRKNFMLIHSALQDDLLTPHAL